LVQDAKDKEKRKLQTLFSIFATLEAFNKMQLPQRHQDTKVHQKFIFNNLSLVLPIAIGNCALVPWWQKNVFRSRLNE